MGNFLSVGVTLQQRQYTYTLKTDVSVSKLTQMYIRRLAQRTLSKATKKGRHFSV